MRVYWPKPVKRVGAGPTLVNAVKISRWQRLQWPFSVVVVMLLSISIVWLFPSELETIQSAESDLVKPAPKLPAILLVEEAPPVSPFESEPEFRSLVGVNSDDNKEIDLVAPETLGAVAETVHYRQNAEAWIEVIEELKVMAPAESVRQELNMFVRVFPEHPYALQVSGAKAETDME